MRALKGAGRPILPAAARAELVAAAARRGLRRRCSASARSSGCCALIKPDVHCKGTDYTVDTVPEREVVRAYGGRIAIVGDPKDHSTRDLLARRSDAAGRTLNERGCSSSGWVRSAISCTRCRPSARSVGRIPTPRSTGSSTRRIGSSSRSCPILIVGRRRSSDRTARGVAARRGATLRARHYDVALDFQGLLKSAALARLSGARRVVGFDRAALRERPAAPFYTERVAGRRRPARHREEPASWRRRSARVTDALEFPLAPVESAGASAFVARGPDVRVRAAQSRRGLAEQALAARSLRPRRAPSLRDRHRLESVVLWGPGEDALAECRRRRIERAPRLPRRRRLDGSRRARACTRA